MRTCLACVVLLLGGCSKGTVGGNPFGTATGMVPMENDDDDESATGEESATGSSEDGISESWSSTGPEATTADPETTTGDGTTEAVSASDPSTSSTTDPPAESSSSTGIEPPTGSQPDMGMYAHCYEDFFDNCGNLPSCVYIIGEMNGFCTIDDCANAAADCDASPGGTATPACLADGVGSSFCALDCAGGATCPTGMSCESGSFDGVTTFYVCM